MVEEQRQRIEEKTSKLVEEIDKMHLRRMQANMHRCAATCCDNQDYSAEKVQRCVENCSTSLQKAQAYVHGELDRIHQRLQRCVMDCNDDIRQKMGTEPSQQEVDRYTKDFETCAKKCVDTYCDLLPSVQKTIKEFLVKKQHD